MLVQKYNSGDIISIKLISGEEIITKLVNDDLVTVTISKPVSLITNNQTGQVALLPLIFSGDDVELDIQKNHILAMIKTKAVHAKEYVKITSAIIQPETTSMSNKETIDNLKNNIKNNLGL